MQELELQPPSLINDIDDWYLSDDWSVEHYDPLDKETIQGMLKEFKRTGEQVPLDLARLYARGLFKYVNPSWRVAMMGIMQHMVYCPLNSAEALTWNPDTNRYDIDADKVKATLENKIAFAISQQWMNTYLQDYWLVTINRKFTSELLHHLGAMGCFKLKTYLFGDFQNQNGVTKKAPTEVTEYDLKLLLVIASEWQELWLNLPENSFNELPHHKGFLVKKVFDVAMSVVDKKDVDESKNHFGSKKGFGSLYPNRKNNLSKDQYLQRKGRRKAAKDNPKPKQEKVAPVYSHLWDSLTMGFKRVFNWDTMNELERMGFKNTQRKKITNIYGTKPITVSEGKQYSSEYCLPPGVDDYYTDEMRAYVASIPF